MANPNMTVAAARNRKFTCVGEFRFKKWSQAQDYAEEMRKKGTYAMVRVTTFKMGPRKNPIRYSMVRLYETA
jgi:hypothetical protein